MSSTSPCRVLEHPACALEFVERAPGHRARDRVRGPDAGHDVLALAVREVLAVQPRLAGDRVAGEDDAGAGVCAHVPEHHRLDDDRRPEVVRDPVVRRGRRGPGGCSTSGTPPRPHRGAARAGRSAPRRRTPPPPPRRRPPRSGRTPPRPSLAGIDAPGHGLDGVVHVEHVEHGLGVHPVEPDDDVGHEPGAAGEPGECGRRRPVEAEVEDGVHHPGHGDGRTRPHGDQQRLRTTPEGLAGAPFELGEPGEDLLEEALREDAGVEVGAARRRGDDVPRWDAQPEPDETGQSRALPAEQPDVGRVGLLEGQRVHGGVDLTRPGGGRACATGPRGTRTRSCAPSRASGEDTKSRRPASTAPRAASKRSR